MKRFLLALTVLLSGSTSFATANEFMVAPLSGDLQKPNPVTSTASGNVTFVYSKETESIMYTMDISNPDGLGIFGTSGANLYCQGTDLDGGLIVPLVVGESDTSAEIGRVGKITQNDIRDGQCVTTVEGIWTFMESANIYLNVHSDENPSGEIRANFGSAATDEGEVVEVTLSGDKEVPPVESTASGIVTYAYSAFADAIVWVMSISNPDGLGIFGASGASIYCGGIDNNGGLIVPLVGAGSETMAQIGETGTITSDSIEDGQCVATIPNLWLVMAYDRGGFDLHVNVHSDENPSGEIRGNFMAADGPAPTNAPVGPPDTSTAAPTKAPTEGGTEAPSSGPTNSASAIAGTLYLLPAALVATGLFL